MSASSREIRDVKASCQEWTTKAAQLGHDLVWKLGENATKAGYGYFRVGTCTRCAAEIKVGLTCETPSTAAATVNVHRAHPVTSGPYCVAYSNELHPDIYRAAASFTQVKVTCPVADVLQSRKGGEIFDSTITKIIGRHVPTYRAGSEAIAAELAAWFATPRDPSLPPVKWTPPRRSARVAKRTSRPTTDLMASPDLQITTVSGLTAGGER
jgi:hypothetical protein